MTIEDATEFFRNIPKIHRKLQTLMDVGLGYMNMGQPATTLSGGEAQRVKLASELYRRSTGRTFYILDEPTTGLHMDDVDRLLQVLHRLVDSGESVLVIEHSLDVIKTADYLIDLGPEGGSGGGMIVATGTPEQVVKVEGSYTGKYLGPVLERDRKRTEEAIARAEASGAAAEVGAAGEQMLAAESRGEYVTAPAPKKRGTEEAPKKRGRKPKETGSK